MSQPDQPQPPALDLVALAVALEALQQAAPGGWRADGRYLEANFGPHALPLLFFRGEKEGDVPVHPKPAAAAIATVLNTGLALLAQARRAERLETALRVELADEMTNLERLTERMPADTAARYLNTRTGRAERIRTALEATAHE